MIMPIFRGYFSALLILLLALNSCDWLRDDPFDQRPVGFEGVNLIISDYPENEIYKGDQFSFALELENRGSTTSERVKLIARNSPYFARLAGDEVVEVENLVGKNKNPSGGYKGPFVHRFEVSDIPGGLPRQTIPFAASLCYSYETTASFFVCGGKTEGRDGGNSCDVLSKNAELLGSGQGAPVAITDLQQQNTPVAEGAAHVVRFTATLENKGSGSIYADGGDMRALDDVCSAAPSREITNTLDYHVALGTLGSYDSKTDTADGLKCSPRKLSFDSDPNNNPKITCVQDERSAFPVGSVVGVPVIVTLEYVYQEGESISITFHNLEGN